MKKINRPGDLKRREFIRNTAILTASALIFSSGKAGIYAYPLFVPGKKSIPTVRLNNGLSMPMLGFGTNTLNGDIGERCVADAISVGYRLIDTAHIYGNEEAVGAGIKRSGIKRDKLFLTSKLWVDDMGYEAAKNGFESSIKKLQTDYLDLYLIHRPRGDVKGSWKAMEELYREGKIKAIGVSNFEPAQLSDLMATATIMPVINQIETHVFFQEHKAYEAMKKLGVQMEAWSPFAAGRNGIFSNETLAEIGKKHKKSIAQVCLRWHYQRGIVAIPRSSQKAHMIENLDIFDFELDESDLETIASLDLDKTQFPEWG